VVRGRADRQHESGHWRAHAKLLLGNGERRRQAGRARARRERCGEHGPHELESLQRIALRQELEPQAHRAEQVQQQDEDAARDEDAKRNDDVPADLDDRAVDHGGYGVWRDGEREVDDARHQVVHEPQR
jgi:hypothetical protein